MKLVTAIVRPEKVNDVLSALFEAEVHGLTVTPAQGHGGETEEVETYRGTKVKMGLVDKVRIEIGLSDHFAERAVQAIIKAARTGDVGDGKIFITELSRVVRIRTSEQDMDAVTPVDSADGEAESSALEAAAHAD